MMKGDSVKRLSAALVLACATSVLAGGNAKPAKYVCSLTKKTIASCCCTKAEDGKLYCTLAQKTIASCCCKAPKVAR
jgi:hypothetical protein